jgi:hypothetical protein
MKIFKKILIGLLIVFVVMQAFRPAKNSSKNTDNDISKSYPVPEDVKTILAKACYDCHSNNTRYPWYTEIQPVGWWLSEHIKDGKKELNFNEFSRYRIARQYKKMEECIDEVKESKMPLPSYTQIHTVSVLTGPEKKRFLNWCQTVRDTIRARYPADSLVRKKI